MTNKKMLLAIPLMVIAVIAIGFGMASNVFAQTTIPATVDQPDASSVADTTDNGTDRQNDGETNDDHNSANQGTNGDGEQNDQTELKK